MTTNIINAQGQTGYQVPGAPLPAGYTSTTVNPTIDAAAVSGNTKAINIPTPTPTTPYAGAITSGQALQDSAEKQAEADQASANKASGLTDTQTKQSGVLDYVKGLFGKQSDLQNASASALQPALDKQNADLADINTQIADTNVKLRGVVDAAKGRADISSGAQQSLVDNASDQYGRRLADLAIRQSAANGNITKLESDAKYALDQKLAPLQNEINYYKDFLSTNLDNLSKSEQAQVQSIIAQKQAIVKQQADETQKGTDAIKTALENGHVLSDSIVKQITENPGQAYQILSKNGISLAKPLSASSSGAGGVSVALQNAINNGTIDPNRINSRTIGLYNEIAQAGVDAVGAHAGAAGETKAITDLSTMRATASKTLNVIDLNLPLVANLADKVNTIGVPGLDAMITGKQAVLTNNPDVVKYVNSLKTLRSEYAQMLAKGGTATEGDKEEAAQAIPAGLSGDAYRALGDQLKLEATNVLTSIDQSITQAKSKSASNTGSTDLSGQFDSLFQQYGGK